MTRIASRDLKLCPNGVLDALTEGGQCAHTAVRDRRPHRFEADTEAGLGRTRFIRVCFTIRTAHKASYCYS
jgi:hypothetical protein